MQKMDQFETAYRVAEKHLSNQDPVMRRLIKTYGPCGIGDSGYSLFHSLASAVISQQLSVQAAETVQSRVMKLISRPLRPQRFLDTNTEAIRAAGLSGSKIKYIRNIAGAVLEDGLSKREVTHKRKRH